MRVPQFSRYSGLLQSLAVFALGMIVGAVVYNAIFHVTVTKLYAINIDLKTQNQHYENEIKELNKYKDNQMVISEIRVYVENNGELDKVTETEIKGRLIDELDIFHGRDIFKISSDSKLVRRLLDKKTYNIRDKNYEVRVRTMLANAGLLQIWVEVRENMPR